MPLINLCWLVVYGRNIAKREYLLAFSADGLDNGKMEHIHLNLSNVHCGECENAISLALSTLFALQRAEGVPSVEEIEAASSTTVFFTLSNKQVDLYSTSSSQPLLHSLKKIVKVLSRKGFNILSWELSVDNHLELNSHTLSAEEPHQLPDGWLDIWWKSLKEQRHEKNHMKNCKTCREGKRHKKSFNHARSRKISSDNFSDESVETVVTKPSKEFRAVFSVLGMTCATCSGIVDSKIKQILEGENAVLKNPDDQSHSVNLEQNTAVVIVPSKHMINKIVDIVKEAGFECKLVEMLPVERSVNLKVLATIGGMTCAACSNTIYEAMKGLPFVLDAGINVVTKTGQFVMEDTVNGPDEYLAVLKETIEDRGYDFEVLKVDKINFALGKKKSRSVHVGVEGMYCEHCPDIITNYLSSFGEVVVIQDAISLSHPHIRFTYIPNVKNKLTIRNVLSDLNHIRGSENEVGYVVDPQKEGSFKCRLVDSVSLDDQMRKLSIKETMKVVRRLVIASIFAIPTFIFGVVSMSLLPSGNSFRKWVEEPIWAGNVARNTWILLFLSTPVYFFSADIFHRNALMELKALWWRKNSYKKRLLSFGSMNLLMFLGTTVSYVASIALLALAAKQKRMPGMGLVTTYFDSVVFLTFFLLIGRLLESVSKRKTADAIANLGAVKTNVATLVSATKQEDGKVVYGQDEVVELKFLETDDYIRIATGESPPVDCIIVEGASEFDESALTGESTPVKHAPGHQVFSGTVNVGRNSIIAKIISLEGESLIDQIVSTVRDGQIRKAPIERTADLLTSYFVPVIVFLAILTWIIWLGLAYSGKLPDRYLDIDVGGWGFWSLEFAIAVFVIACPCGIGLAAPTALFVGSGLAAKNGVLAKGGGVAFQDGASANVICFDKTGTLTYGELKVSDYAFATENELESERKEVIQTFALQMTRDLESASKHPLAKAVKDFIDNHPNLLVARKLPQAVKIPQVETVPGKGLKGNVELDQEDKSSVWNTYKPSDAILGNEGLLQEFNVAITEHQQTVFTQWKKQRKSLILTATRCPAFYGDERYHLVLALACRDQIRAESKVVVEFLQKQKIDCWMITGDNRLTADAIGKEIGIPPENIISEVLPDDKQNRIKMLQKKKNSVVAMIGDGINDAPALATADVGIALSSGADLAVTSSDFILLNKAHPLVTLVTLLDLSKTVFRRVKFNFAWSLVYNLIGIPVAAGVIYPYHNSRLNPVWASAAMAASSVSVVLSSLALKVYKPKIKVEAIRRLEKDTTVEDTVEEYVL